VWTISDALVLLIARKCEDEETFRRVFYEGHIRTPEDFLQMIKKPANVPVFIFRGEVPVGFAWLNGFCANYAFGHFCFLRTSWGVDSEQIGSLIVRYWLNLSRADGSPILDVIIGAVPGCNTRACNFVQRIGFKLVGSIPTMLKDAYSGQREDAVLFYYSRFEHGFR
jgi:hypothetical protein